MVCSKRRAWEMCTEKQRGNLTSVKSTLLLANPEDCVAEKLVDHRDYSRHTHFNDGLYSPTTCARDFTSLYSKPITDIHPDYRITSHQSKTQLHSVRSKNQHSSLSMYPSPVYRTVKWNTDTQSSFVSINDSPVNEEHDDNCWCESCATARYNARLGLVFKHLEPNPPPAIDRPVCFHSNIAKFCNQCTMTPQLNDVSCGSSKGVIPLLITSEMVTSGTNLTLPQASKCHLKNTIEKKPQCDTYGNRNCFAKAWLDHKYTVSSGNISCGKTCPWSLSKHDAKRKILYNEGISDDATKQLCVMHKKHIPQHDINERTSSKLSMGGRCYREKYDNYIPYSHNVNSKYHQNCTQETLSYKRSYVLNNVRDDGCHPLELEPLVVRQGSAGVCFTRSRCINMPKKLLTSEKNIEAFLSPKCTR